MIALQWIACGALVCAGGIFAGASGYASKDNNEEGYWKAGLAAALLLIIGVGIRP